MGSVNTTKQCNICQTGTLTEHEELMSLVRRGVMLCVTEQWYSCSFCSDCIQTAEQMKDKERQIDEYFE